ncbi:MAG TPA: cell division topological specificity factor MinE [Gammaproteobacteria bacterium]|jgi:cell division topological specificity factor|nr:cell division topological specificity factor MinE [Gammaproteobacteria bacterium]
MNLTDKITKIIYYFRRPDKTAKVAKERLKIIIAHERSKPDKPDYLPLLQKDLLAVIAKYVTIHHEDVRIELERKDSCSILELNVVLPYHEN